MTESELNLLASKIVSRMMRLKSMEDWFNQVAATHEGTSKDYEDLDISEEDNALGESAKLLTLMNLFQDREEYEKCAIVKRRLDVVNEILGKF